MARLDQERQAATASNALKKLDGVEKLTVCDCKNHNRNVIGAGIALCSCGNWFNLSQT